MRRRSAKRSFMPPLTMSFRWMTPSSLPFFATASGVPPGWRCLSAMRLELAHVRRVRRSLRLACDDDRIDRALAVEAPSTSRPLMRVGAVNGNERALAAAPCRGRGCRTSPWPARRSSGPPASRRPARPAARRRRVRARSTPGTGMNSVAMRLPRVMVPVLSSSRVSTSPAASTARPDMASTLNLSSRSMPAMPMAESRPPMVVGIRQTNSAPSTRTRHGAAGIGGEAREGDDRDHEDERQAGEQDGQRDLVRRLPALGAFDHGDHAVEEGRCPARR